MIVIFDYGVGNLTSIMNMINKSGNASIISSESKDLRNATKIILPGMGHFDNCMKKFNESGKRELITNRVVNEKVPVLGICVGLQMFFQNSEEGTEEGLCWVKGRSVKFNEKAFSSKLSVPNMGWLDVEIQKPCRLVEGLEGSRFYFAHSFHVVPEEKSVSLLEANYGYPFTVAIEQENILGVQFHPEKSHRFGMKLLQNFAERF